MRQIFLLLFLALAVSRSVYAQTSAVKFDEFTSRETAGYLFDDDPTYKERLARFVKQLKGEPRGVVAYIIHYRARVSTAADMLAESRTQGAKWEITSETKVGHEDVVIIDGGVRDEDTLEFWIGRRGGKPPESTPAYIPAEAVTCPSVWLDAQASHVDKNTPAVFSVLFRPTYTGSFTWSVSAGRILEGQGTGSIKVDVTGLQKITVSVVADNLSNECRRETRNVFDIGPRPILVDEFGRLPESDLRARFDAYLVALSQEPSYRGYTIIYGRRDAPRSLEAVRRLLTNHIHFRNFDANRIKIVEGGYREQGGMQIWLLPPGVTQPQPQPTVDSKFVVKRPRSSRRKRLKR